MRKLKSISVFFIGFSMLCTFAFCKKVETHNGYYSERVSYGHGNSGWVIFKNNVEIEPDLKKGDIEFYDNDFWFFRVDSYTWRIYYKD